MYSRTFWGRKWMKMSQWCFGMMKRRQTIWDYRNIVLFISITFHNTIGSRTDWYNRIQSNVRGWWSNYVPSKRIKVISIRLQENKTRSRTRWRRRMGETWSANGQHYAPGRRDTITHSLKETNERNMVSIMPKDNETWSRTAWRRRMGETWSAVGSETMRHNHVQPEDRWEQKIGQHYTQEKWNTIAHSLKETIGRYTIGTRLRDDET